MASRWARALPISPFLRSFRRSFSRNYFREAIEAAEKKNYVHSYDVEITPPLPPISLVTEPYTVQKGNYNGWWLRIHGEFSAQELQEAIAALEAKATSAVYVTFAEHMFSGPKYLPILESLGYQFHHYLKHEFVYYRWVDPSRHDMVPTYATSIEGGAAVVLSPTMERVFLVKELNRSHWGLPGGAVNPSEGAYEAMRRELLEEADVQLDPNFAPLLVCLSNQPRARDNLVNDHFTIFTVRATSEKFNINPHELADGKWFEKDMLLEIGKDVAKGDAVAKGKGGDTFAALLFPSLRNWQNGRFLERTHKPYLQYPVNRDWYW